MNKEQLAKIGLTEEQAEAVMKELDGAFVPKSRFNEVNTELKQAKDAVKERDARLEALKKAGGDVEALNKQITDLQAANKAQADAHSEELKRLRFDAALSAALTGAKARNPETVKPLLKGFLEKAEMDEKTGAIKDLDKELEKLAKDAGSSFLFEGGETGKPALRGMTPKGSPKGGAPAEDDPFLVGFNSEL